MTYHIYNNEKGVSLIIVFLIMAICVSIALGVSTILIGQFKIANEMGNSVRAIFLADSGIEKTLYYDKNSSILSYIKVNYGLASTPTRGICGSINNLVVSHINPMQGCGDYLNCPNCALNFVGNLPSGKTFTMKAVISSNSTSTDSFFQSTGKYSGTSRQIQLDILR